MQRNNYLIDNSPTSPKLYRTDSSQSGFTIIELLVVVVVIGILAAITIVSYVGIQQKAVVATLQSDLTNGSQRLKLYQISDSGGNYPAANECPTPSVGNICLKASGTNIFTYTPQNGSNPKTFTLDDTTNGTTTYRITNDSAPVAVVGSVPTLTSPTVTSIVSGGATLGANITFDGGANITARGTCWDITPVPVANCLAEGGTTTGVFTQSRAGIPDSATIYFRGYATNSVGTAYSADASFSSYHQYSAP